MPVRYYRWDDQGAPTLNGLSGSLIQVMDAVLINGYGSKSPAGWSKPFSLGNVSVYQQATRQQKPRYLLRVDDSYGWYAEARAYERMQDVNTGDNVFPTPSQQTSPGFDKSATSDGTPRKWIVVADDRTVILAIRSDYGSRLYWRVAYFGDIVTRHSQDVYSCSLIITVPRWGEADLVTSYTQVLARHYIARNFNGTVSSPFGVFTDTHKSQGTTTWGFNGLAYPFYGRFLPGKAMVTDGTVWRGWLRGLWVPLQRCNYFPDDNGATIYEEQSRQFIVLRWVGGMTTDPGGCAAIEISNTWDKEAW